LIIFDWFFSQVTTSELSPPGTKNAVLMLAENETERQRWVGALNELQKLLRRNKLPFKFVSIQEFIFVFVFRLV